MKTTKRIIIAIVALLIASVVGVSVYALGLLEAPPEPSGIKTIDLREYNMDIDETVVSKEILDQILAFADTNVNEGDVLVLENNFFTKSYCDRYKGLLTNVVTIEEDRITVDISEPTVTYETTDGQSTYTGTVDVAKHAKHLIVISIISSEYESCLGTYGYGLQPEFNCDPAGFMFICPSYEKAGYDNATEYYHAWRNDECELTNDAYLIGGETAILEIFEDGNWIRLYGIINT